MSFLLREDIAKLDRLDAETRFLGKRHIGTIGYALLVLFFVVGVVKTMGSFVEVKKPEHAIKLFVRFALAKGLIPTAWN